MKLAMIIADGVTQISFEPETDWERAILDQVRKHTGQITPLSGRVFECQGNYWRGIYHPNAEYSCTASLILKLEAPVPLYALPSEAS